MNYLKEAPAKNSREEKIAKERREVRVMLRYLLFYCALITVMSLVSYGCDLIFYLISYGKGVSYIYSPVQYIPFYMILGFMIFPLSFGYNYLINELFPTSKLSRAIIGVLFVVSLGCFFNIRYHFGFYIGSYRVYKNLIAMAISGWLVEVLRNVVVAYRYRPKA